MKKIIFLGILLVALPVNLLLHAMEAEKNSDKSELSLNDATDLYWDSAPFGKSFGDEGYLKSYDEYVNNMQRAVPVLHRYKVLPQHHYFDPLPTAVLARDVELVRLFVESGFDPGFRNMSGTTAYDMLRGPAGLYIKDEQQGISPDADEILKAEIKGILDSYQPQPDLVQKK